MSKKKKILVTGSCGFIFSNFMRYAITQHDVNYKFISVDKVKSSRVMYNVFSNKNHTFHIGDVADSHFMDVVFQVEEPDIVIHAAAESFVDSSIKNADPFIHSNVRGTQTVIDACVKWGVERLVYISSDEIYGQLTSEDDPPWPETAPMNPRNPYSATKAAGELLVKAAHQTHGLNYNITRCCNNYGPRQDPEKFLPKIIKCVINNEKIPVYGQGRQVRDWLYVSDNCRAVLDILEKGAINETYNIAANQEYSNIEICQLVCNALGKGHDLIEFVEDRPGHDFRYSVDCTKLKGIGWEPEFKFKQGLEETAKWYINNKSWFLK